MEMLKNFKNFQSQFCRTEIPIMYQKKKTDEKFNHILNSLTRNSLVTLKFLNNFIVLKKTR